MIKSIIVIFCFIWNIKWLLS